MMEMEGTEIKGHWSKISNHILDRAEVHNV